ncbi:MAG: alpha/beta hydrolase fold protein, partial [Frankiales bacterium]|nr:alpha/beta hydrolase fold protein [Frankiales bacterium]
APALQRLRRAGSRSGYRFTRDYLFGDGDAEPGMVRLVQDLLEQTPFPVSAAFYPLFVHLDERAALDHLRGIPVTLLVGAGDRMTPAAHSRLMAERIGPSAELIVVPGAGHSVNLTRRELVDDAILALVERAVAGAAEAAAG